MGIYNKTQQDFKTEDEWNRYVEDREDIIFNLAENIDLDKTKERIRVYE